MANTLSAQTAPQTTAEYEAEFDLLMQEATRNPCFACEHGGKVVISFGGIARK